jgi:hypothetical protein
MRNLPVHDVKIQPFGFEDYVLKFYSREDLS